MDPARPLVFVVDDEDCLRRSVERVLAGEGYTVETFATVGEFLARPRHSGPACLILDVCLPDLGGLEVPELLAAAHYLLPIVFVTGHADVATSVRAMKLGAVDFLPKPFDGKSLFRAVEEAMARSRQFLQQAAESADARDRCRRLTTRERDVLDHLLRGQLNKQIAADLGISEVTVKIHRGRLMRKLGAQSVVELVHLARKAGLTEPSPLAAQADESLPVGSPPDHTKV